MAYIDEHSAQQPADTGKPFQATGFKPHQYLHADPEVAKSPENRNFQIARNLAEHKANFINALANFPATALWLLQHYEQGAPTEKPDDHEEHNNEILAALSAIKNAYLSCVELYYQQNKALEEYLIAKQTLRQILRNFPFTFEELTTLADLMVYAFQSRAVLPMQFAHHGLILKRLGSLKSRHQAKLAEAMFDLSCQAPNQQFLFLSRAGLTRYITKLLLAEQNWLAARQQLASANTKLVLYIANQFKGGFLDFDDLVQEGQTGLLKAVDRYNYQLGFQFSTYASYWIRQAISRSLSRYERVVRLPFAQMAAIHKVYRSKEELTARLGKEPTLIELAQSVDLSLHELNNILAISQTAVPFLTDENDEQESAAAPESFVEQTMFSHSLGDIAANELTKLLAGAINTLNSREAKIVCSHFGINVDTTMTLQELGNELNLTRERVRQIQLIALHKIKQSYGEQLMSFL